MTMMLDAARYNTTIRQLRHLPSAAENGNSLLLDQWIGPATELLLDMTHVRTGTRVLDLATDAGDQALQVVERVGVTGHVLATSTSPQILERAAHNARSVGLGLQTLATDAANLDVPDASFDAAVCRMGLTYIADPQRALGRIRRALVPGGRFGAIVFSTPENNPCISLPLEIIRRHARLPDRTLEQPGLFWLSQRGLLFGLMESAGFRNIEVRAVSAPLRMASAAHCVRFERESFGELDQMLAGLDAWNRAAAWAEIVRTLRQFERDGGFEGPCELLIASGVK